VPSPSHRDELRLSCRGCGAELGLDRRGPLIRRLRPFVEQHRSCAGTSYDVDSEMRTAFKIPA